MKTTERIDPRVHYAGRAEVSFTSNPSSAQVKNLNEWIDHAKQQIRSSTGELALDYGAGRLTINAPQVQGISGNLQTRPATLRDCTVTSDLDSAHIVIVSLDGQNLTNSKRMLLQVMSEEKATGFASEDVGGGMKKITDIGRDPWQIKNLSGTVTLRQPVTYQPLDFNGYLTGERKTGAEINLAPGTIYYLLTR